jgi:hypothetical protein
MKSAPTSTKRLDKRNDCSHINRMTMLHIIVQMWQERYGKIDTDHFDFAADVAYKLSDRIPSDVLLNQAQQLTVSDILSSNQVQHAELTKRYKPQLEPEPDHKSDAEKSILSASKRLQYALVTIVGLMVLAAIVMGA